MKNYKIRFVVLIIIMVVAVCSCTEGKKRDALYNSAAEELVCSLESNGYTVEGYYIEQGYMSEAIVISIDDYSDDKAEEIFNTCIFPYMSSSNTVIRCFLKYSSRDQNVCIEICSVDEEQSMHYSARLDFYFEVWENADNRVLLEDYR